MNDEYEPLSPRESRQFWSTFTVFIVADLALILTLAYGLKHGWFA
jgi:hypothetical protein